MSVSVDQIKELRAQTGAGMMDCKKALLEAKGDLGEATKILRQKGLADLKERAGRTAKEGMVDSYIHADGKIGVLVEINCETDFVARNADFRKFVHDVAMQIAAANPTYVGREEVSEKELEGEKEIYRHQALAEGKPEKIVDKIIEGRLEKFYKAVCLLEQPFIKDPDITIESYLGDLACKLGEKIVVNRFVRFQLGEEADKEQ
jgi:elongation factor Ts